jgi:hypothetical protein
MTDKSELMLLEKENAELKAELKRVRREMMKYMDTAKYLKEELDNLTALIQGGHIILNHDNLN